MEETRSRILFLSRKRFSKYAGSVNELFALIVYRLNLDEIHTQLNTVPRNRPTAIHACPVPRAYTVPGSPISSHPLISDAWADSAATHPLRPLPPRK